MTRKGKDVSTGVILVKNPHRPQRVRPEKNRAPQLAELGVGVLRKANEEQISGVERKEGVLRVCVTQPRPLSVCAW